MFGYLSIIAISIKHLTTNGLTHLSVDILVTNLSIILRHAFLG